MQFEAQISVLWALDDFTEKNGATRVILKSDKPDHECEYWSTMGECTKNPGFMSTACRRSCSLCAEPEEKEEIDDDLLDDDEFYDRYQDKDEV